jgi:hypothetical protein
MKSTSPLLFLFCLLIGASGCRVQTNPPELVSVFPKQAFVGQEVTLTGYQFGSDPVVTVGGGTSAVAATVSSHDDNTIRIIVPRQKPGSTPVRVGTDEGSSDPLPLTILQPAPTLTSVTPANGLPGSPVVLSGNYLNQLNRVRFDEIDAVVQDSSAEKLTVLVPTTIQRGPVAIVIETSGGELTYPFIVAGTPRITALSTKRAKPGTELVIQGVNLLDGIVRLNGSLTNRDQTTVKDTEIRTIIPSGATSGLVTVTVFEKLIATSADSLQIVLQPAITSLSARDGIAGDKIVLTGFNLRDIAGVSFGSLALPFRVISDTQVEITVPALPASGAVSVSVNGVGGNASASDPFFYYLPPSGLTVSPARQVRGQPITISGQNLYRITDVRVNGQSVPITDRTEGSQLLVNVPINGTSGPVTVINRAGTATSNPLIVVQKPIVSEIIPPKARPGERIVLRGNFLLNAQVFFTGTTTPAVDGGKNEDAERWVLVPAEAQTGPIRISNASREDTFTEPFIVTRLATIADYSPKTAKAGDELTFVGQNLSSVTQVRFNGGNSTPARFRLVGGNLVVTVPADAATGQVCLTNEAGSTCTTATFTVTL